LTSKRYALTALFLIAAISSSFVLFNMWIDEFGLYGDATGQNRRIWTYNRASKYLLSLNHIPANYEGILIGSSSSASMIDTRLLKGHRIYNLSMNGANICEVSKAALKALKSGKMKNLLICLDPYLTRNSHMKTSELRPDLKKDTLGSLFMVKFYLYKLWYTLQPEKDPYRESWQGHRTFLPSEKIDMRKIFEKEMALPVNLRARTIDPKAKECLKQVIDTAHEEDVAILAYFHPRSEPDLRQIAYGDFRKEMLKLFEHNDRIIDMTGPDYAFIRHDPRSYNDHVHLSAAGAKQVLDLLRKDLDAWSK